MTCARRAILVLLGVVTATSLSSVSVAQRRPEPPRAAEPRAPAPESNEIRLDEQATLRAAAIEARMSAIVANFALLQRQAQDLQQEMSKVLEERKRLIEEAARRANVEVRDVNEWAFDNKNQRYVRVRRPSP
ncbi:MAG: hypothetical protein QN194_15575 [Armatimonadota bacterium]|nr:hypothetical protein [Armatimonadota bacterium]